MTREFLVRIERAAQNLTIFPFSGRPERVAEGPVPNTPFLIACRIKEDEVHLLAVLHSAHRWSNRL